MRKRRKRRRRSRRTMRRSREEDVEEEMEEEEEEEDEDEEEEEEEEEEEDKETRKQWRYSGGQRNGGRYIYYEKEGKLLRRGDLNVMLITKPTRIWASDDLNLSFSPCMWDHRDEQNTDTPIPQLCAYYSRVVCQCNSY